jgi:hypothetical protein
MGYIESQGLYLLLMKLRMTHQLWNTFIFYGGGGQQLLEFHNANQHICSIMWSFWAEATLSRVFFIVCLYMYCRWRPSYVAGVVMLRLNGLTPPYFCVGPHTGRGFPTSYVVVLFVLSDIRSEVIVRVVDIGGIVAHYCLNSSQKVQCILLYLTYFFTIKLIRQFRCFDEHLLAIRWTIPTNIMLRETIARSTTPYERKCVGNPAFFFSSVIVFPIWEIMLLS